MYMGDLSNEEFTNWLRDLPADFIYYLYKTWKLNDVLASNGSDLSYVGPLTEDLEDLMEPLPISYADITQFAQSLGLSREKIRQVYNVDIKKK